MLDSVLRAPMSYFETTPLGRILNRFTYDVEVVDLTLTEAMAILMIAFGWFFAGVSVICSIIPWMAFALGPVVAVYVGLLTYYRKSGADLQRIDAVSRSPVQSLLAEGKKTKTKDNEKAGFIFGVPKEFVWLCGCVGTYMQEHGH